MFAVLDKEKNKELHTVNLRQIDLTTVYPGVLARVVVRLKNVNLSVDYRMRNYSDIQYYRAKSKWIRKGSFT